MGMMGQLDGQKAQTAEEQAEQTATSSRGRRSAGLDAKDEAAYTRGAKPGMDEGEEPQSVFPSQNKPSKEDELKTALEDKYNQILGMTDEQKSAFVSTDEYEKYQDDWEALEKLLGTAAYEQYRKELFGGGKGSGATIADNSYYDGMIDAYGNWSAEVGAKENKELLDIGIISTIPELVTEDINEIINQLSTNNNLYVTKEQYETIKEIINQNLSERYDTDFPTQSSTRENILLLNLEMSREWSMEQERKDICNDLEELTGLISNKDLNYIIRNITENSDSISKSFIVVDYTMQNQFDDEAEMSIEEAEEFYKAYTRYLETAMDITSLGTSAVIKKLGELFTRSFPKLIDEVFDIKAPIIKEGNYMIYTTCYTEHYGNFNACTKEHDIMVLVEVNEDGTKKEQGYVYTFDYTVDTPYKVQSREAPQEVVVPIKYPYFYTERMGN